jgi:hypothetical protein
MRWKQVRFRKKKIQKKEVGAALCITSHTFSSKSGMQWSSKASVIAKRETCNFFFSR